MTACKMNRPIEAWASATGTDFYHKDDMPAPHADFAPGNMGCWCAGEGCALRAPRTDSDRLHFILRYFRISWNGLGSVQVAPYVKLSGFDLGAALSELDAAMDREGESNG